MADITVTRDEDANRYTAEVGGGVALIEYRLRDGDPPVVVMTHTEVPEEAQGEGVASELVRQAVADVRARGERIEPRCQYVRSWLDRHPDEQDVVASS